MATTCLGPHWRSGGVDALADLAGRRRSLASSFCISSSFYFRGGTLAYVGGNSSHPGPHARCGARRRRNRDAARNSRTGRRKSDPRQQRACRRKRSVQRHSFIADIADDRPAFWRIETTLSVSTRGPRCVRCCNRVVGQLCPRSFPGPHCRDGKPFRS